MNCTADVKALSDACCTSSNAAKVVNAIDSEHILFVPDQNLANYVQTQTAKQIISWDGNCYVHHQITPDEINKVKSGIPGLVVIAHPECRADVLALADAVLSTSAMMRYAKESPADKFLIVTECGLSDRLLLEVPEKHFYKACKLCRYMKMITLEGALDSLQHLRYEVGYRKKFARALSARWSGCSNSAPEQRRPTSPTSAGGPPPPRKASAPRAAGASPQDSGIHPRSVHAGLVRLAIAFGATPGW